MAINPMPVQGERCANASSVALAASRVIKNARGRLINLTVCNTKASAQYIQLHDATALPADTAVPACVMTVAASSSLDIDWTISGRDFINGIVVCNSSTAATKTIGSADCFFDAQYR